jgi:peptidoglycan/xylan/chitin deacetylase (PgdA/CDA1 family)
VLGDIPLDPQSPPGFLANSVGAWSRERTRRLMQGQPLGLFDLLTGQLSIRRSVFEAIGGFDGKFTANGSFGNEDLDIGLRLLERHRVKFNAAAISHQRYVVTAGQHMRQWHEAGKADVAFALKHPQRGGELFELHGSSQRRVRLLYRPLGRLPFVPQVIARVAVLLADATGGARPLAEKWIAQFFFAAREILYWSGVADAQRAKLKPTVLVLCYHAIADLQSDPVLANYGIKSADFARQLDRLVENGYNFIGPQQLHDFLEYGADLPAQAILLSFDDCYAELPEVARTILRPRGIPALAFAVTGMQSSSNEWDQAIGAGRLELLNPEQLQELPKLGVEVGCHSRNHREMPKLDETELWGETDGAAQDLEAIGLPRPRYFAYPYGEVNTRSKAAVIAAGFSAAFGLAARRMDRGSDRLNLPRVEILARDTQWRFWLKIRWPRLAAALR